MEAEQKKEKILIVDDLNVNVAILENIIRAEGYEPLCALSVQEALDIMNHTMPQLILSDFSMPGMDGLQFCELLKSNPCTRDIPFIFITVANSNDEKRQAFAAGAVDYILKPFERAEIVMRVNNQLNSYRIKQQMEDHNRMMHRVIADQKRQMEEERNHVFVILAKLVEERGVSISGHLERIGYNCRILAQSLQLVPKYEQAITDEFVEIMATASKLHGIGSLVMPDDMLKRKYHEHRMDTEEVRFHTSKGVEILEQLRKACIPGNFFDVAIAIAKYHHAYWDGNGCPEGISGEDIPLEARIAAIVNDFDNIYNIEQGDKETRVQKSVEKINQGSGSIYDPFIIKVFNKITKQLKTD